MPMLVKAMDDLPPPLLLEILSRLGDQADLARCRVASKTLNSISRDLQSLSFICTYDRYAKSRSPPACSSITPFKQIFLNLVSNLWIVKSVSIGIEKPPLSIVSFKDFEDNDDLYLTDVNFVEKWLPRLSECLKSVSISDFWVQSCRRRSSVLDLISSLCYNLVDLDIKKAWLSVNGLKPMPNLTSLTLDYVRLDDENLDKICECFPGLQVLNLVVVGQLKDPQVRLLNLRSCNWTLVNAPNSVAVVAPKLQKLKLKCTRLNLLVVNTPVLEEMHLCILESNRYMVGELLKLESLHLQSMGLQNLIQQAFSYVNSVRSLTLWDAYSVEPIGTCVCLGSLSRNFPNLKTLTLSPRVWSDLEGHLCPGCLEVRTDNNLTELQRINAYLVLNNMDTTLSFILAVVGSCPGLKEMALLIHRDVVSGVSRNVIAKCEAYCQRIRWRWGIWKEGAQDVWISDQLKSS